MLTPWDSVMGKHFPLWVVKHFRDYHLREGKVEEGIDLCKESKKELVLELYQTFLAAYLLPPSPSQGLLIYHGLGSGKTASAINIMKELMKKDDYNFFILLPAALQKSWSSEMALWGFREKVYMISTNASNLYDQLLEAVKASDSTRKSCYIIDEAHNFIHNVYSNMKSGSLKGRALSVYDFIENDVRSDNLNRIILLSGTPIRSHPFEAALLFNLLRHGSFPKDPDIFESSFVKNGTIASESLFQRRIMGLVSYYTGDNPGYYAKKRVTDVVIPMSQQQDDVYFHFEKIEKKLEQKAVYKGMKLKGSFRTITRLMSNFTFDTKRPRPATFRLTLEEEAKAMKGKLTEDADVLNYLDVCQTYLERIKRHLKKGVLKADLEAFKDDSNIPDFISSPERSATFTRLYQSSAKMVCALLLCFASPGKTMFYSNFVKMEGIEIFKIYLEMAGISYVEYTGSVEKEQRAKNLASFNKGEVKVILISAAGSEGISILNIRRVIILEPHWNEDVIQQVIGRAIRRCSHASLPLDERYVDIFRLKAVRQDGSSATDTHVEVTAFYGHAMKQSFLRTIQGAAVDCDLFKPHNRNTLPCFRFSADETLLPSPGPSYLKDITQDDTRDYAIKRIRVKKVMAAVDKDAKPEQYHLDDESGVLYDIDFSFPIGRVRKNESDFLERISDDVFKISDTVSFMH